MSIPDIELFRIASIEAAERRQKLMSGWPPHADDPETEWAKRLKGRSFNPTGTAPQVQDAGHIQWGN